MSSRRLSLSPARLSSWALSATLGEPGARARVQFDGRWVASDGQIDGSDTVGGDAFGASVAVSGTTVVVGSFGHAAGAGRSYLFTGALDGHWRQVAEWAGAGPYDAFGQVVALSGGVVAVGSVVHASGTARVYPLQARTIAVAPVRHRWTIGHCRQRELWHLGSDFGNDPRRRLLWRRLTRRPCGPLLAMR